MSTLQRKTRGRPAAPEAAHPPPTGEAPGAPADPLSELRWLTAQAQAAAGGTGAWLLAARPTSRALEVVAVSGAAPLRQREVRAADDPALAGWDAPPSAASPLPRPAADGTLVLPVALAGEPLGALFVRGVAAADPAAAGSALEQVVARVAPLLGARTVEQLRTQLMQAHAIVDVGQALTEVLFIEEVLLQVINLAEALVSGHSAAVALRSGVNELELRYATGTLKEHEGLRIPVDGSLTGWVVRNDAAVATADIAADPRSFRVESHAGPGAVVPIRVNGTPIGAFLVTRLASAEPMTEDDLRTLQQMSGYAAVAIQNARLYQDQQAAAELLRTQAAELQAANDHLTRSQQQLLVAEKMAALGRITAGIAHEINSPLSGVMNAVRTTRGLVEEYRASAGDPEITVEDHHAIAADMQRGLELAQAAAAKLGQFVRSIKAQTRAGERVDAEFDPSLEIDGTIVLLNHNLRARQVAVFTELERGHLLRGDPAQFGMVVQNLVNNAADAYEGRGGEVWIRLSARGDRLHLRVEDQGCGIPEENQGKIFDYLFTTKDVGQGTGLGLAMVHSLVTSVFHGEIGFRSAVGAGTTFELVFPLLQSRD